VLAWSDPGPALPKYRYMVLTPTSIRRKAAKRHLPHIPVPDPSRPPLDLRPLCTPHRSGAWQLDLTDDVTCKRCVKALARYQKALADL
jgi:hypothetical protein